MSAVSQNDVATLSESAYCRALRLEGKRLVAKSRGLIVESHRIRANAKDVARRANNALRQADMVVRRP